MKKIHINPGHGGKDPGACRNGMNEKDITLTVAKLVARYLQSPEFSVSLTRETDEYVPLTEIARKANAEEAELFISIHVNCATNASASGIETLVYRYEKENKRLPDLLQRKLLESTGFVDRGVKERPDLLVLNSIKMTAALVELGFLSNVGNAFMLKKEAFLENCAKAVSDAVFAYFGVSRPSDAAGNMESASLPAWQKDGLDVLVAEGIVNDRSYWEERMEKAVTVGELVGLLGKTV